MQKKLMAIAVAGALGVPAVAMAQASTVQVYGRLYVEYDYFKQGIGPKGKLQNVDTFQTEFNNIGFKGEEKLGGGLSAWFQCESTADIRGGTGDSKGFCSRNSAVGIKGGFGNAYVGTWDTPFKRTSNIGNAGARDFSAFGTAVLLYGSSTTTSESSTASSISLNRITFRRRQRNSINYDSPNFYGFQVSVSTSTTNGATAVTTGFQHSKPRIWSVGATYNNGPVSLGAAYEQHHHFGGNVAGAENDFGWLLDGTYTLTSSLIPGLPGKLKVGGVYTEQNFKIAAGQSNDVRAWHIGADWNFYGPHTVQVSYTNANATNGPCPAGAALGTICVAAPGAGRMPVVAGGETGARQWHVRYLYALSKRTEVGVGYSKLLNDPNANYSIIGAATPANGQNQYAVGLSIEHIW